MKPFEKILQENKEWAAKMVAADPDYFKRLVEIQTPEVLWIGCRSFKSKTRYCLRTS